MLFSEDGCVFVFYTIPPSWNDTWNPSRCKASYHQLWYWLWWLNKFSSFTRSDFVCPCVKTYWEYKYDFMFPLWKALHYINVFSMQVISPKCPTCSEILTWTLTFVLIVQTFHKPHWFGILNEENNGWISYFIRLISYIMDAFLYVIIIYHPYSQLIQFAK